MTIKKLILSILNLFLFSLTYSQDNKYLPSTNNGIIIKHNNYIISYVEKYETSEWVCYELTYSETKNNVERKNGDFLEDKLINTGSAIHDDYLNSGFDRGHLAPAGDMNFSLDAMLESFYMSNVSPQTPELNRKTWKYLENDIRYYVMRNKSKLYIITGCIYSLDSIKHIGIKNRIAVPTFYYKIIYDDINNKIVSFIIPNIKNVNIDYFIYITTVDNIEIKTNIDFFNNLDKNKENKLESYKEKFNWLKK